MPQELHVVRCYACKTFQVQIVKKVPKWQCKLCNEKQSLLKVYAEGSGKDCRQYVQDLNFQQGLLMSREPNAENSRQTELTEMDNYGACQPPQDFVHPHSQTASKWNEFLEDNGSTINFDNISQKMNQPDQKTNVFATREDVNPSNVFMNGPSSYIKQGPKMPFDLDENLCTGIKEERGSSKRKRSSSLPSSPADIHGSKWSKFVAPDETTPCGENPDAFKNVKEDDHSGISSAKFELSSGFCGTLELKQKSFARDSKTVLNNAKCKNPFDNTDDDTLDTLLEF